MLPVAFRKGYDRKLLLLFIIIIIIIIIIIYYIIIRPPFGIVVSTSDCHPRGPGFDLMLYPRNFSRSIGPGT